MRALVLPLAAILALVTGLGLLAVATTLSQAPLTVVPTTANATTAVQRFYAAADTALRTGDPTPLQDAIAPGFVDHAIATETGTGLAGYRQFLADLRMVCSDCRLTAEDVATSHDQVAVHVTVHGHRHQMVAGVAIDGLPLVWSALDVLRVVGGRVTERWSRGDAVAVTGLSFLDPPDDLSTGIPDLHVARFILRPGANLPPLTVAGPALLVVEEGMLTVRADGMIGSTPSIDMIHIDTGLGPGERLVLTPGLHHSLRNDGATSVVVLILATGAVTVPPDLGGAATPTGATPAAPALTDAAVVAPGAIAVTGRGFTPGGRVYVALYDVWGAALLETRWTTASPTVVGRRVSADPATEYVTGGAINERFDRLCGTTPMVRAYDATTATWSTWLDVDSSTLGATGLSTCRP